MAQKLSEPMHSFSVHEDVALDKFIPHVPVRACAFGLIGPFLAHSGAESHTLVQNVISAPGPWVDDVSLRIKIFAYILDFDPKAAAIDAFC